jgi:hypothetical protein
LKAATIRPNAYSLIVEATRLSSKDCVCCQNFSGDPDHHDQTSPSTACHDSPYGHALRNPSIARANRADGGGAGQGRAWSRWKTKAEGSTSSAGQASAARCGTPAEARSAPASAAAEACCAAAAATTPACPAATSAAASACPAAGARRAACDTSTSGAEDHADSATVRFAEAHRFAEPNGDAAASAEA